MTSHPLENGMQPSNIATPAEVLETFTQLMRGEKGSEQLKAAEQLAKYHSLFAPKEENAPRPEVIEAIDEAVQRIRDTLCEELTDDAAGGP